MISRPFSPVSALALSLFLPAGIACSTGSSSSDAGPVGGELIGAADDHCFVPDAGLVSQTTAQTSCTPTMAALVDAGIILVDGGPGPDAPTGPPYGPTHDGTAGYDDDCKYYASWTSTPVRENVDVYFTVTATDITTGEPVTGAQTVAEVYLNTTHPAPNSNPMTTEAPLGTYIIGPIRFDEPGQWTIRFHFFELCEDLLPDSPHGHDAFFVSVP